MALQKCHSPIYFFNRVDRDPPKTMCIVKILYKYLYGSAEVPQSKILFNGVDRDPPKTMCIVKILYKYLYGSAEVPQSKNCFNRVGRDPPKNHVHSEDTVQVS